MARAKRSHAYIATIVDKRHAPKHNRKEKSMSRADEIFIEMCRDILDNGTSTEGEKVRPHWPDGEPAYTIKKFGVVNRYDLSKEFQPLS